jgi:hypothetical protein
LRRYSLLTAVILVAVLLAVTPMFGQAQMVALDYDIPDGHFFTQTNGQQAGTSPTGYSVLNADAVPFWDEFNRQGGTAIVGYPMSRRFNWDGFTTQVFQKAVFQWKPIEKRVDFINVFDQMSLSGKDDWLLNTKSTPKALDAATFDAGKGWDQIVAGRLALLNVNPAIKSVYNSARDPLRLFGLPTSTVVDNGNHYAIRLQRAVIQQWKIDVPWARAGQATIANGGDVAVQSGMFAGDVVAPDYPPGMTPPATPTPTATPKPAVQFSQVGAPRYFQNEGNMWVEGKIMNPDGSGRNGVKVRVMGADGWTTISRATGVEWRPDPNGVYSVSLGGRESFKDYRWTVEVYEDNGTLVTSDKVTFYTDQDSSTYDKRQVAFIDFRRN